MICLFFRPQQTQPFVNFDHLFIEKIRFFYLQVKEIWPILITDL